MFRHTVQVLLYHSIRVWVCECEVDAIVVMFYTMIEMQLLAILILHELDPMAHPGPLVVAAFAFIDRAHIVFV